MKLRKSKGLLTGIVNMPVINLELQSEKFLKLSDEQRQARLNSLVNTYPDVADEIRSAYRETILNLNPLIVAQLREVFRSKLFQTADERQRQFMLDKLLNEPAVSEGIYRIPKDIVEQIMREETVDKPGSIFNVMQEVRQVFQSKMFNDFSAADKEQYIELMLQQPQILKVGLTRDDLLEAYREIEVNTEAINRVTSDPLFLVLARLDPKSALRSCEVTAQFRRLCQNPNLFRGLMRVHYPNYFETANPKEQYKAITARVETTYRLPRDTSIPEDRLEYWETFLNPIQYGKTQLPHRIPGFKLTPLGEWDVWHIVKPGYVPLALQHLIGKDFSNIAEYVRGQGGYITFSPQELDKLYEAGKLTGRQLEGGKPKDYKSDGETEIVFKINGYPIPPGTKAWLLIIFLHRSGEVQVFKTKEDLAKYVVDRYYDLFKKQLTDDFFNLMEANEEFQNFNQDDIDAFVLTSPAYKSFIQQAQLPFPFTPENLYRYVLEHDSFRFSPEDTKTNLWLFREVTF